MAEARRSNLGDDLISELVRAEQEGERLTEWELAMLLMTCSRPASAPPRR